MKSELEQQADRHLEGHGGKRRSQSENTRQQDRVRAFGKAGG